MTRWTTGGMILLCLAACGGSGSHSGATPSLDGTSWHLLALGEADVPGDVTITAAFAGGKIEGQAGCNRYFAAYTQHGDSLAIGPAGATKMMCPDEVMAWEDEFLGSLAGVRTCRVRDGRLQVSVADGGQLTFAPAPAAD